MKRVLMIVVVLLTLAVAGVGQERMPLYLQDETTHIIGESANQFLIRENMDAMVANECKNPHRKIAKESCETWAESIAGQTLTFATSEYAKIVFINGKLTELDGRPGKKFYLMNPEFDEMTKVCIILASDPTSCATYAAQQSAYQYAKSIARIKRLGGYLSGSGYSSAEIQAAALVGNSEKLESAPIQHAQPTTTDAADVRAKSEALRVVQKEGLDTFKADSAAVDAAPDDAKQMKRLTEMVEHAQSADEAKQHALENLVDSITTQIDDSTSSYEPDPE